MGRERLAKKSRAARAEPAKTSPRQPRPHASRSKPAAKAIPAPDAEVAQPSPAVAASKTPAAPARRRETAETMGRRQREISVAEFFQKNSNLLGFDNPAKARLTATKEAVDNSLDACEEAGILPEISVVIEELAEDRFRLTITDNGPGIVRNQVAKVFGKLLYGSKFHVLR